MLDTLFQISVAFHLVAAFLFLYKRTNWALFCLLVGGIILRFYFAELDPFLHDWDERFHALVAKNLTNHWLTPTLIDSTVLPTTLKWNETHIWLHKQPLFLWQMALSIKLFGANELAVRLPSLMMTSGLIIVIYSMGKALFDETTGFVAAFVFSCYQPLLEMNSGMKGMDHNDIAFLFYVTLSIWAWVYFEKTGRSQYLLMMGFFSGCAVLNKWLTGLLVFSGYIFYHLFLMKDFSHKATLRYFLLALVVCLLTFLPWQIYILIHFPIESRYEYAYNSMHLYRVVEGHGHETWYYFNILGNFYKGLQVFIPVGLIYSAVFYNRHKLALTAGAMMALVYIFFTIADTKLESYVMIAAPIGILFIARSFSLLMNWFFKVDGIKYGVGGLCFLALFWIFIDTDSIADYHFVADNWQGRARAYKNSRAQIFRKIAGRLPAKAVIIDPVGQDDVDAMFYTGHACYESRPQADYKLLKKLNYPVVFHGESVPDYAKNDANVTLIRDYLR